MKTNWQARMDRNFYPLLQQYIDKPAAFIEVGVLRGHTARWLLDNILLHPLSRYYGIDIQDKRYFSRKELPHYDEIMADVEKMKKDYPEKFKLFIGLSADLLAQHSMYCGAFAAGSIDFIHLDANCNNAFRCMQDFYLSWPLLKSGGSIVLNNTTRNFPAMQKVAAFLLGEVPRNGGELVFCNRQLCFRKK